MATARQIDPSGEVDVFPDAWNPRTLISQVDAGKKVDPPFLLRREDGPAMLYRKRLNVLFGKSEQGKSWLALRACIEELDAGGKVLYLDFEDDEDATMSRLSDLGYSPDERFLYTRAEEPLPEAEVGHWVERMLAAGVTLVVIDTMDELLAMLDKDPNQSAHVRWTRQKYISPLVQAELTVIVIDHMTKDAGKTLSALTGSQAKAGQADGAVLLAAADNNKPPTPGSLGLVRVFVMKDRHGLVRKQIINKQDKQVANVWFKPVGETGIDLHIEGLQKYTAPDGTEKVDHSDMIRHVLRIWKEAPDAKVTSQQTFYDTVRGWDVTGSDTKLKAVFVQMQEHNLIELVEGVWKPSEGSI